MILSSETDSTEFELRLIGYEFPRGNPDEADPDWLLISIRVKSPAASWTRVDPSLMWMEARELAGWLESHALNRGAEPRICFLEPNLSFEVARQEAGVCDLRLYFAAECRPPGFNVHGGCDDFRVTMRVSTGQLRDAAVQLREELLRLPARASLPVRAPDYGEA